jgi:hypothetical protein
MWGVLTPQVVSDLTVALNDAHFSPAILIPGLRHSYSMTTDSPAPLQAETQHVEVCLPVSYQLHSFRQA